MNASAFKHAFDKLNVGHVKNFDPMRFAFIEGVAKRLKSGRSPAAQDLLEKAMESVEQYQLDFNQHRQQARDILDGMTTEFSEHADIAQAMYERCQFKQLAIFIKKLEQQELNQRRLSKLNELVSNMNKSIKPEADTPEQLSIDDVLFQQEQSALVEAGDIPVDNVDGSGEQLVMQSMKQLRKSMKHFNIDKIIARAINEGPENPGPLNPQMLAIKSLTQMRDLSPAYLRRFASHIETLLWLEKNASKLNGSK